jgi:NAD(P)-dependent dehydrogenase (short-subunit alcohol dehydrogenase family)
VTVQSIKGQTALVTGGGRRIGRAIALELAEAGVDLVVHYHRSQKEAEATAEEARELEVNAIPLPADLASPAAAADLFARAVDIVGDIDILVNNASIFLPGDLMSCTEEDLHANIRLHAATPLQLAQCLAAAGRPASIVNLLDTRVAHPDPAYTPYSLSKCMLADLTRMLALELGPGIRVNGVAPGPILPPEGQESGVMQARAKELPLQATGDPRDVSAAVLFLLRSTYITGQIIYVDGGSHLNA